MSRRLPHGALLVLLLPLLHACGTLSTSEPGDSAPSQPVDLSHVQDPVPRALPHSRYGNPESYEVFGVRYHVKESNVGYDQEGIASWYGTKFHGRRTSSGEPYDMYAMTAAHKTLPIPVYAEVTNLENGRQVIVKINDRGPFHEDRIIDLSYAAAYRLDFHDQGTAPVRVRTIVPGEDDQPTVAEVTPAGATPALLPEEEAIPEAGSHWFLQVGAFRDAGNARQFRERLNRDAGIDTVDIQRGSGGVHRVRVGPLSSAGEADRMGRRLADIGIDSSLIVQE